MDPTDILMNEHQVIKQVLRCLERLLAAAVRQRRLDASPARQMLRFFGDYAERVHLRKEEGLLFPAIRNKGMTAENALIGDLRDEHLAARAALEAMGESLAGAGEGDVRALETFVRNGRDYAAVIRRHIRREDEYLFPMADLALGADERRALLQRFRELDDEALLDQCTELADELADRYGISKERFVYGANP